jgi:hypothetical protein
MGVFCRDGAGIVLGCAAAQPYRDFYLVGRAVLRRPIFLLRLQAACTEGWAFFARAGLGLFGQDVPAWFLTVKIRA